MAGSGRLLVVDDDATIRELIAEYFGDHGFEVAACAGGVEMRDAIEAALPDVVLLDLRLPGEDGLSLARFLRERCDVGIIMVTGSADVVDRVVGLELGADDYVAKPFDLRELLARVRSVLRRMQARPPAGAPAAPAAEAVRMGRCLLDPSARCLRDDAGDELPLTAMEFDLLEVFLRNPNRVLSRDQLLVQTRNREWEPFDRSIDIRIARLRRKIEVEPDHPRTIRTVRGAGYMFVPTG